MKNMKIFEQSVKMRKGIKVPNYKKKRVKARENMKFSRLKILHRKFYVKSIHICQACPF